MMNLLRTGALLAALTALFVGVGFLIGNETGMTIALVIALATNAFAYWYSDSLLLRTYGAREITRASHPELYALVAELARGAELPLPRLYVIDNDQPNAFATGRNPDNAALAVHTGLLRMLTREEVAGVIGHELAHIRNYDTLTMTVTATLAGAVAALANIGISSRDPHDQNGPSFLEGLLIMLVAPFAAGIIQMAISRSREYEADRIGATISGQPNRLADALLKIHQGVRHLANPTAEANPATTHVFIMNPLQGWISDLFASHPPTAERVRRLRAMTPEAGAAIGRVARTL